MNTDPQYRPERIPASKVEVGDWIEIDGQQYIVRDLAPTDGGYDVELALPAGSGDAHVAFLTADQPVTRTRTAPTFDIRAALRDAKAQGLIRDFSLRPNGRATIYHADAPTKCYTTSTIDTLLALHNAGWNPTEES